MDHFSAKNHVLFSIHSGSESKVPVGVLDLRLELLPKTGQQLDEEVVKAQVAMERTKQAERER